MRCAVGAHVETWGERRARRVNGIFTPFPHSLPCASLSSGCSFKQKIKIWVTYNTSFRCMPLLFNIYVPKEVITTISLVTI